MSCGEVLGDPCADPGSTWSNIALYTLGNKATPTISAPADRTGGGREVTIAAITDGSVTTSDQATHFALTDDSESKILVAEELDTPKDVVTGNPFTITEFKVGTPDYV